MKYQRADSIAKKTLSVLLAAAYLTIFIVHDVVFEEPPVFAVPGKASENLISSDVCDDQSLAPASEHHCPFCSGFVDTHAGPFVGTMDRSWLGVSTPDSYSEALPIQHSCRPRDPPDIPA
ncbi:MAG TPA: hypothetical protein VMX35_03925 [Acidobacteriota bacterium]|nr:hypothetical protein [Acidobacteriota bacterium]